tara:strand:- start:1659 stop:3731 length:2073 start_codon:yes stop_codon:yes gene_type:complete
MVAADKDGRAFHITEKEAEEFRNLKFLSPEERAAYLKNRDGWTMGDNERNLGFSMDTGELLPTHVTRKKWNQMNQSLKKYALDDDGLTSDELRRVTKNIGNIDMPHAMEKNKYVQFDRAMKREAGQGFASVGAEDRMRDLAAKKGIDWKKGGNLKYFKEAVRRRDATQRAIDRAMKTDKLPNNQRVQYHQYGKNAWATKITGEEMDEIRRAAGVEGGPLPENMQELLEQEDVKTAIGKGIVSDVAERAAQQRIFSDADLRDIERVKKQYGVDASIDEMKYVSPSIRTALEHRKRYDTLRDKRMTDGLLDRAEVDEIKKEMTRNMRVDDRTVAYVMDNDSRVQDGTRAMERARDATARASGDMYITAEEQKELEGARQAFINEKNRFGTSEDLQRLTAAEQNTGAIKKELHALRADDTVQATRELSSYDMVKARKQFVNEQQDMHQRVKNNPAFSAAVKEQGFDPKTLTEREGALNTEARNLARSVRVHGRSDKQQRMYETRGMVGTDKGSSYVPDTLESRARFGIVRNEALQNRVNDLKMEAAGIRECIKHGDCSAFDYDSPGEALDALTRIEKTTETLESTTMSGKGFVGKAADAVLGKQRRYAQGAQPASSLIEETFTHGGKQPDRIEQATKQLKQLPSTLGSTMLDAGKAGVELATQGITEAGSRMKQAGRILDKATGEWVGVSSVQ